MAGRTVIFDFDGTIADTMGLIQTILARVAPDYGYPSVSRAEFDAARALTLQEIIRKYRLSWWRIPLVLRSVRREQQKFIHEAPIIPGMAGLIGALRKVGMRMGILSNNREDTIRAFCAHHGLTGLEFVCTVGSLFGKGKVLKRLLRKQKIDPRTTVYIGDEVKDIEAGREAGVRTIAVAWGFHTPAVLRHAHADMLVETAEELEHAIQNYGIV